MEPHLLVLIIIGGVLILLVGIYFLVSYALVRYLSYPKKHETEWTQKCDVDKGLIPEDMSYMKREKIQLKARDGVIIECDFSLKENHRGIVVLAHGYTWTREGCLKYAQFLYKHGFSIFLLKSKFPSCFLFKKSATFFTKESKN